MKDEKLISNLVAASPNRRSLLRTLGIASTAAGAVLATGSKLSAQAAPPSVVDVLQFALNLEYLEAEFYTIATMGQTIDQVGIGINGTGTPGPTTGGNQVNFANNLVFTGQVAMEIGQDERNHVTLLRGALTQAGITPIAKPAINLAALASAGLGFGNIVQFLALARVFEDIGVTAYGGAAGLSTVANSPYIGTAAQILAAEAEHVGNIRLQCARLNVTTPKLDGVDIVPPPAGTRFISVDGTTGLSSVRTPGQVLYLAYGMQAGVNRGGFFPNGANGTLNTSSASA